MTHDSHLYLCIGIKDAIITSNCYSETAPLDATSFDFLIYTQIPFSSPISSGLETVNVITPNIYAALSMLPYLAAKYFHSINPTNTPNTLTFIKHGIDPISKSFPFHMLFLHAGIRSIIRQLY